MINVVKRFHGDESAQISFLAVAGVICFVGLMSMVINTNDIVTERVHMQDVADATVLSAASWTARGLNTISFVNVLNTKLISTAVLLNALADAIPVIQAVGQIQQAIFNGCSGVPFIGAFCAAMAVVVTIQLKALNFLKNSVVDPMAKNLSQCSGGNRVLWKMMKGLEKLATVVQKSFAVVGIAESISIAKANGATLGLVVNGRFTSVAAQLTLPVKQTEFTDHCPYIKDGGPGFELQSYSCNEGPLEVGKSRIQWTLLVPWTNFVAQPIFSGMVSKHNTQIRCTNDPGEDNEIPVTLNSLDQCSKYDVEARWSHVWAETVQLTATQATFTLKDFIPWRPRNEYGGSKDEDDATDLGELQEQLEDLQIPGGDVAGDAAPPKPLGKAVEYIDPNTEHTVYPKSGVLVNCRNPRYPSYVPPSPFADYDWNANRPGQTSPWSGPPICPYCRRIDEWGKFTWVSGQHVVGGPQTSGGYFIRVDKRDIPPNEEGGETKYVYVVETVSLVSAGEVKMDQEEFDEYLEKEGQEGVNAEGSKSSSGCGGDQPIPWVLDKGTTAKQQEDFQNRLRFIGIVWKDMNENPPFWNGFFNETPPTMYAYAQGQVYNHLAEDTFTQDWRVRLEQASLLESFLKSDAAGVSGIKKFLGDAIGAVNNH